MNRSQLRRLPRVVTRSELARLAVSDETTAWQIGRENWIRLAPAVYATVPEPDQRDVLTAALLHGGSRSMISGEWALSTHGFRSARPEGQILVLIPYREGVTSTGEIRIRRASHLPAADFVAGLRLAPPARAVIDACVRRRRIDDVRAVVAESVQGGHCGLADLSVALREAPRRGSKLLRTAIDETYGGARSAPEARAALTLRRNGFDGFAQNVRLRVGAAVFIADILWEDLRAVLEIDSAEHHYSQQDWQYTLDRDAQLQGAGYAVLHITPAVVANETMFIRRVGDWLAARRRMISGNSAL